jgi:hypothetical protein
MSENEADDKETGRAASNSELDSDTESDPPLLSAAESEPNDAPRKRKVAARKKGPKAATELADSRGEAGTSAHGGSADDSGDRGVGNKNEEEEIGRAHV